MIKRSFNFVVLLLIFACNISCEIPHYDIEYHPTLLDADANLKDDSEYIIVIGDIQEYTDKVEYFSYLYDTMDWILSQVKHGKKIKCVLQTGDLTWTNMRSQYDVFYGCTVPLAEYVPYISCPGNHDYDYAEGSLITNRFSTLFSEYTSFSTVRSNLVGRFEPGRMENIIVRNEIHGQRYDIISLEFGPRPEVLQWVFNHVQSNPDIKYILMTHEYLNSKGQRVTQGSNSASQFVNQAHTTPEQLWQYLVRYNNNIVCVLCGHNGFSRHSYDQNDYGRDVAQILFNLQYQPNGGDGWVQIWEFPKYGDNVNVDTYNTITRQYHSESHHSFRFKYKY